jgi:hypothetical protein
MQLTSEQRSILAAAPTCSRKVAAFAGCGKTSTLVEYARAWPGRGLYLAFNRVIADEARIRLPRHIETRTAHSFAYKELGIDRHRDRLTARLRFEHLTPFEDAISRVPGMTPGQVRSAILRTLQNFLVDSGSKVRGQHCNLVERSQRQAVIAMTATIAKRMLGIARGEHAFTHDVYLKCYELWHGIEPGRFDYLLLDEAQDLNPVLISLVQKAKIPALVVGDPYQSIYAFRGAVNAMSAFDGAELPLSQSWRFGPAIAVLANKILRHSSRPPRVALRGNPARETNVRLYKGKAPPDTAILARTNARLFSSLVKLDRPFHLVGGFADVVRQVGSAHALARGRTHEVHDAGVARFTSWHAFEDAAYKGNGEARRLRDIVALHGDDLPDLLKRLTALHRESEDEASIVVSTAHKAKGREWRNVVVLDDFEPPAVHAKRRKAQPKRADDADQEINLLYVACTRATDTLWLAPKLYEALN